MKTTATRLKIQFQQITQDNTMNACVLCPLVEELTSIIDCQGCGFCEGLELDQGSGKANIVCNKASTISPPQAAKAPESRAIPGAFAEKTPVSVVMTSQVVCVQADLPLLELAELLEEKGLSGVPVIDKVGHPIGIVSKTDLVRTWYRREAQSEELASLPRTAAWQVMNPIVTVLHQDTSIAKAASLFASEGLHRAPIVDEQGKVVGLLSSTDILRWLAVFSGELPEA
jgi:CBS-domain-containing membrane protein